MEKIEEIRDVRCPKCGRLLCKAEKNSVLQGIHFWCSRCKEEVLINKK